MALEDILKQSPSELCNQQLRRYLAHSFLEGLRFIDNNYSVEYAGPRLVPVLKLLFVDPFLKIFQRPYWEYKQRKFEQRFESSKQEYIQKGLLPEHKSDEYNNFFGIIDEILQQSSIAKEYPDNITLLRELGMRAFDEGDKWARVNISHSCIPYENPTHMVKLYFAWPKKIKEVLSFADLTTLDPSNPEFCTLSQIDDVIKASIEDYGQYPSKFSSVLPLSS